LRAILFSRIILVELSRKKSGGSRRSAGAARRLDRAVSVISYGIANLESQLGAELLERAFRAFGGA
jgi:hypothetical protein